MDIEQKREYHRNYNKNYRLSHKEKLKENVKRYREKNKEKVALTVKKWKLVNKDRLKEYRKDKNKLAYWHRRMRVLRKRAKERGIVFELSGWDIKRIKEGDCEYCGIKKDSISIDRKDNNIGYTINNCVSACSGCNTFKGAHVSYEDMKITGDIIKEVRKIKPNFWSYTPNWTKKPKNILD
jgi:hypothetical protein